VVRAAKRLHVLREADAKPRTQRQASARLDAAMDAAVEHTGLATDPRRQDSLMGQIGALYNAAALADLEVPVPGDRHRRPDMPPAATTADVGPDTTPESATDIHESRDEAPTTGPWARPASAGPPAA
jgi:hypothetical protein